MPHFDIVKTNDVKKSFRVAHVMGDYDVKIEHSNERFVGDINIPDDWHIGVIVGGSGTGKTTIAKQLFGDDVVSGFKWNNDSILDNMPKDCAVADIEKMFYAVGLGSVPSWLKPFDVLSNGEKMRVELARALLEKDFVVFDEFTSVVDRQVAQTMCVATNKAIHRLDKKFIAVSCHYDIIEYLQPDWVFDTNTMSSFFTTARDLKRSLKSESAGARNGKSLGVITI